MPKPALYFTCLSMFCLPSLLKGNELDVFYAYYQDSALLSVNSPSVRISHDWNEALQVAAKYTFERFIKEAPESTLDAVSSASVIIGSSGGSGFQQDRHESSLSVQKKTDQGSYTVSSIIGLEEDFESRSVAVSASRDFLQRNVSATALYAYTFDSISRPGDSDGEKDTHNLALTASQILSQRSVLSAGYNLALVQGYQANPLRQVEVNIPVPGGGFSAYQLEESPPEQRLRQTTFSRLQYFWTKQHYSDVNGSAYQDDWGVSAWSLQLRHKIKVDRQWRLRFRHRYYRQSGAEFYQSNPDHISANMTADQRLRRFDSQLNGLALSYSHRGNNPGSWSSTLAYDYYRESNKGIKAHIIKLSARYLY